MWWSVIDPSRTLISGEIADRGGAPLNSVAYHTRMLVEHRCVHDNARARRELGWAPRRDFRHALDRLARGQDPRSDLALAVGAEGYHAETTGVYTVR